jgi:hypothetical protein
MPAAGFEPAIPASKRTQAQSLERPTTGIDKRMQFESLIYKISILIRKLQKSVPIYLRRP